jgi:beta-N-acetylhexosaminidase
MDRRNFLLGIAGTSAALAASSDTARRSSGPAAEWLREVVGETLIMGFSGSDAQSPSAQALAEQIRAGSVGGVVFVKDNIGAEKDVVELTKLFSSGAPRNIIIAIDHEGGAVQRLVAAHGCSVLPSAQRVAADYTVDEAQELYADAGRGVARHGALAQPTRL